VELLLNPFGRTASGNYLVELFLDIWKNSFWQPFGRTEFCDYFEAKLLATMRKNHLKELLLATI